MSFDVVSNSNFKTKSKTNFLDTLKPVQAVKLAQQKVKESSFEEAKDIYNYILSKYPNNKKAIDGFRALSNRSIDKKVKMQDPPQYQLQKN